MTSPLNVAMIRKLRGSLMCVDYVLDVFSKGVCTTGNWKTSGRLVQELNVYTVVVGRFSFSSIGIFQYLKLVLHSFFPIKTKP